MTKKIRLSDHPPQSPDLNPIETFVELYQTTNTQKLYNQFWGRYLECFLRQNGAKFLKIFCEKLIQSIPKRIQAVIEAKGGPARY